MSMTLSSAQQQAAQLEPLDKASSKHPTSAIPWVWTQEPILDGQAMCGEIYGNRWA